MPSSLQQEPAASPLATLTQASLQQAKVFARVQLDAIGELGPVDGSPGVLGPAVCVDDQVPLVLIVDDEPGVLHVASRALRNSGYETLSATTAVAALALLHLHPRISLLLTDYLMPDMDGMALVRAAREWRADLPVVLMTGYADFEGLDDLAVHAAMLTKPFRLSTLRNTVEAVMVGTL